MENEAIKNQDKQLVLFSGGDAVENLIYEFLKAFFEFTAKHFSLPRSVNDKLLFEETAASNLGIGTLVKITIPIANRPKWLCPEIRFSNGSRIGVIDDDPSILEL